MKISIITATYNSSSTIADAMASVAEQTHPFIEHLIIDGNSTDNTLEIVEQYSSSSCLQKVFSSEDLGIYDALNKGFSLATGDIVGILHSDDSFYSSNSLAKVASRMLTSHADGCYGDLNYISKTRSNRIIRKWKAGLYSQDSLKKGWMPPHPTLFLRSNIANKVAFDLKYKISSDYDLMLKLFMDNNLKFEYIPEVLVNMKVGGESNKSLINIFKKMLEDYSVIKSNNLEGLSTLIQKNLRKISQFKL